MGGWGGHGAVRRGRVCRAEESFASVSSRRIGSEIGEKAIDESEKGIPRLDAR
jgi:hypothetical protein